jgi:hypothetical protein
MAGKARKSGGSKRKPKVTGIAKKPQEVQKVRNQVVNLIVDESVGMAERVVRSGSERGNLSALKFLWEVAGMFPGDEAAEEESEDDGGNPLLAARQAQVV